MTTTSEMLTALRTVYPSNVDLNKALDPIWQPVVGERTMMKIEAIHILYNRHFNTEKERKSMQTLYQIPAEMPHSLTANEIDQQLADRQPRTFYKVTVVDRYTGIIGYPVEECETVNKLEALTWFKQWKKEYTADLGYEGFSVKMTEVVA